MTLLAKIKTLDCPCKSSMALSRGSHPTYHKYFPSLRMDSTYRQWYFMNSFRRLAGFMQRESTRCLCSLTEQLLKELDARTKRAWTWHWDISSELLSPHRRTWDPAIGQHNRSGSLGTIESQKRTVCSSDNPAFFLPARSAWHQLFPSCSIALMCTYIHATTSSCQTILQQMSFEEDQGSSSRSLLVT